MSYIMVGAAAAGLAKSEFIDRPAADRQRKLASETQKYSPWTGLKGQPVKEADPVGSALSFGLAGAQVNNGLQQQDINNKLADKALSNGGPQMTSFNAGGSSMPYGGGGWQPQQPQSPYSVWGAMNGYGG